MSSKNEHHDREGCHFFILGIVAAIFLWIAAWQLCDLLLKNKKTSTQIAVYFIAFIVSLAILFYLGNRNPKFVGFTP